MQNLDLGEVLRTHAKQEREAFHVRLAKERANLKMHVALLRALAAHGVEIEFNEYDAVMQHVHVGLFERDERRLIKYDMRHGVAVPILARTPSGTPIVGILGKLLGLCLSCARHEYPERSANDSTVYYTDCSFLVQDGAWKGWRIYWRGLFNDRPDQKCHVRESESTYLSIQCDVSKPVARKESA